MATITAKRISQGVKKDVAERIIALVNQGAAARAECLRLRAELDRQTTSGRLASTATKWEESADELCEDVRHLARAFVAGGKIVLIVGAPILACIVAIGILSHVIF